MTSAPHPNRQRRQPPPTHPPGVPVSVGTSGRVQARGWYPMMVEFAPGHRLALRSRRQHLFYLPPAIHHVRFYTWYFGIKVGRAETTVDTRPGLPVYIEYAAPYTIWARGNAGPPPQERRGRAFLFVIIGFLVLAVLLMMATSALTAMGY